MSPTDNFNMTVIHLLLTNSCSSKKKRKCWGVHILFLGVDLRSPLLFPCVNLPGGAQILFIGLLIFA